MNSAIVRAKALLLAIAVLSVLVLLAQVDRKFVLDNYNYQNYFRYSDPSHWLNYFQQENFTLFFASLFTEEFIWRLYTLALSRILDPDQAIVFTTMLSSLLISIACLRLDRPLAGFLLWVFVPIGLSVVGFYQIRQGLAFSIFFYGLTRGRPLLSIIIAAGIHTTFFLLLPVVIFRSVPLFYRSRALFVFMLIASSVSFAAVGEYFFANFGGRRSEQYDILDGAGSINFAIGGFIIFTCHSLNLLISHKRTSVLYETAAACGAFVASFTLISFLIFPIGTSRVSYFWYLFLIIVLSRRGAFFLPGFRLGVVQGWNWITLLFVAQQSLKWFLIYDPYEN